MARVRLIMFLMSVPSIQFMEAIPEAVRVPAERSARCSKPTRSSGWSHRCSCCSKFARARSRERSRSPPPGRACTAGSSPTNSGRTTRAETTSCPPRGRGVQGHSRGIPKTLIEERSASPTMHRRWPTEPPNRRPDNSWKRRGLRPRRSRWVAGDSSATGPPCRNRTQTRRRTVEARARARSTKSGAEQSREYPSATLINYDQDSPVVKHLFWVESLSSSQPREYRPDRAAEATRIEGALELARAGLKIERRLASIGGEIPPRRRRDGAQIGSALAPRSGGRLEHEFEVVVHAPFLSRQS